MRHTALILLSILVTLLAGCMQSVQPFYKEDQLVAPGELVGTWINPGDDSSEIVVKVNPDGKSCVAEFIEKGGKTHRFDVHIARLGGKTIADFVARPPADLEADEVVPEMHHGFVVVEVRNHDTLLMSAMDHKWFKRFIEANPNALKHEKIDSDQILLTATTDEIQAFVIEHFETPGAFGEPGEFRRAGATTMPTR